MKFMHLVAFCALAGSAAFAEDDSRKLSVEQAPLAAAAPAVQAINVEVALDRADGRYRIGEAVGLSVRVSEASYLTVFNVAPDGSVTVLFPNRFHRESHVAGGTAIALPGAGARLVARAPAGTDLVKVIASATPIDLSGLGKFSAEGPFVSAPAGSAREVARALGVDAAVPAVVQPGRWGEASVTLVTETALTPVTTPVAAGPVTLQPVEEPLSLTIEAEAPIYRVGDAVSFTLESNRACALSVMVVGPTGQSTVIFPVAGTASVLPANTRMRLSGVTGQTELKAAAPAGRHGVHALCAEAKVAGESTTDRNVTIATISADQDDPQVAQASTIFDVIE